MLRNAIVELTGAHSHVCVSNALWDGGKYALPLHTHIESGRSKLSVVNAALSTARYHFALHSFVIVKYLVVLVYCAI
jgi:hypothetical protein